MAPFRVNRRQPSFSAASPRPPNSVDRLWRDLSFTEREKGCLGGPRAVDAHNPFLEAL